MYSNCFPTVSWSLKPWNGLLAWVAYSYPLISEKFVTEMSASKLRLPGYLVWKGPASGPFWFIPSSFWGLAKAKRKKSACRFWWCLKSLFWSQWNSFFQCSWSIFVNKTWSRSESLFESIPNISVFFVFGGGTPNTHENWKSPGGTELDWRPLAMDDGPGTPQMVV